MISQERLAEVLQHAQDKWDNYEGGEPWVDFMAAYILAAIQSECAQAQPQAPLDSAKERADRIDRRVNALMSSDTDGSLSWKSAFESAKDGESEYLKLLEEGQ